MVVTSWRLLLVPHVRVSLGIVAQTVQMRSPVHVARACVQLGAGGQALLDDQCLATQHEWRSDGLLDGEALARTERYQSPGLSRKRRACYQLPS